MSTPSEMLRVKGASPVPARGLSVQVSGMTKRFGSFAALEDVSIHVKAGSFHALLGENGAGKSTLVKCLVGFYHPDEGQIQVDERERAIHTPQDSQALGIGMVYQHFTLVPSMTAAENLVMSRNDVPAVLRWKQERERLAAFMDTVPFQVPLDRPVSQLAAGEKQKLEILKQIYLGTRFMILDEPTSVLTPGEADEVLGMLRQMTRENRVTILMITHKFREVMAFADAASVLRRGRLTGEGRIGELDEAQLAQMMVGSREVPQASGRKADTAAGAVKPRLEVSSLRVHNDAGLPAVEGVDLVVRPGEILGVAGVSGNGQKELVQALIGQRPPESGSIRVEGQPYSAKRREIRLHQAYSLPEEPLRNACVPGMSVAENMALRNFDRPPMASGFWLHAGRMRAQAERLIGEFKVSTRGPDAPIATLSGGNVQRAVLARELSEPVKVLVVANPVFGLDFAAVAEIHDRILAARNAGAAVLLVSEDLDELLELSDRIVVMFEGRIVHQTTAAQADVARIGPAMAGHGAREHAGATQ